MKIKLEDQVFELAEKEDVDSVNKEIGDLSTLKTADKTSVVKAINETFDKAGQGGSETEEEPLFLNEYAFGSKTSIIDISDILKLVDKDNCVLLEANLNLQTDDSRMNIPVYFEVLYYMSSNGDISVKNINIPSEITLVDAESKEFDICEVAFNYLTEDKKISLEIGLYAVLDNSLNTKSSSNMKITSQILTYKKRKINVISEE